MESVLKQAIPRCFQSLKNILNDRPIGFICHGHSLKLLDENIDKFSDIDICWGSLNNYKIAENILNKEHLTLDFICASSVDYRRSRAIENFSGILIDNLPSIGNTLHSFLCELINYEFRSNVFLFGADGFSHNHEAYYQGNRDINGQGGYEVISMTCKDTEIFNRDFPDSHGHLKIFNVSPDSKYEHIQKIGIDECLSVLSSQH